MEREVAAYLETIARAHRDLFDRMHRLILDAGPDRISDDEIRNLARAALGT